MSKGHIISFEPLVTVVNAENLRVGKQVLTEDGWQTIRGLVMFQGNGQVSVYTDERDDGHQDFETDGWLYRFGDRVQTRLEPTDEQTYQRKRRERIERKRQRRLAMAAAECPEWCVEHYDGGAGRAQERNHASAPLSVIGADVDEGAPVELGFWLERRDSRDTGGTETVIVIEVSPHARDIELTPCAVHQMAARLQSLGHRGELFR